MSTFLVVQFMLATAHDVTAAKAIPAISVCYQNYRIKKIAYIFSFLNFTDALWIIWKWYFLKIRLQHDA